MNNFLINKFNEVEKKHWWWEGRREVVKLLIKSKRPKKILDIGCGTGETLTYIKSLFPKALLYGIDTSSKAVTFSKRRGHKNIYKASATKLPFKNQYFDVILILDVLEHIENDQLVLNEINRVLKKNGTIIITSPGLSFIWSTHDTKQGHKRRYTRSQIKQLAVKSGLKVNFISYFNFFFCFPIIIIRLLSRLKSFRRLANFDQGINFDLANISFLNTPLKYIFISEVGLLRFIKYPIGISIAARLQKK
jgi:SAM-dependent methyltransferase